MELSQFVEVPRTSIESLRFAGGDGVTRLDREAPAVGRGLDATMNGSTGSCMAKSPGVAWGVLRSRSSPRYPTIPCSLTRRSGLPALVVPFAPLAHGKSITLFRYRVREAVRLAGVW